MWVTLRTLFSVHGAVGIMGLRPTGFRLLLLPKDQVLVFPLWREPLHLKEDAHLTSLKYMQKSENLFGWRREESQTILDTSQKVCLSKTRSSLEEKIISDAINKLMFCVECPHGDDTRVLLTVEESCALLAIIDEATVQYHQRERHVSAHGNTNGFDPWVYTTEQATILRANRLAKIEHHI
jgi:hypothetical protein